MQFDIAQGGILPLLKGTLSHTRGLCYCWSCERAGVMPLTVFNMAESAEYESFIEGSESMVLEGREVKDDSDDFEEVGTPFLLNMYMSCFRNAYSYTNNLMFLLTYTHTL